MKVNSFLRKKRSPTNMFDIDVNSSNEIAFLKLAKDSMKMALFLHHGVDYRFAKKAVAYLLNN